MFTKTCKALLMLMALLAATKSFSQCSICSTPAAPVEYGGVWNATYYKGATLQLWAVNPAIAVCELDWYHVVGTDTTFLGTGDTLSTVTDTTCQYIARTKNTCSGGSTYYSSYVKMSSITVVTGTVPTYTIGMSPTICSGTYTDMLLWSATNGVAFNYLRNDTPSITGSLSGQSYAGPMSVTLTNTTGSSQTVRMVIRMRNSSNYYANDEVVYFTMLASTASSGDHCYAPSSPAPIYGWTGSDGVSPGMFCKGSTIQMEADSTITADSVQWYKVVGTDTTYAGQGYWINVTTDTSCQYIARNANYCSCNSGLYYSAWTSMAVYQVTSSYSPPNMHITDFMPTIASGTQLDIGITADSSGIARFNFYKDNANVSPNYYVGQIFCEAGITLTNATSVPQLVRLWVVSVAYPTPSGVSLNGAQELCGNSQLLYVTVLPSTTTGTGHCTMPPLQNNNSPGSTVYRDGRPLYYVKGATINLDLGNKFDDVITADSVYWYKTRWPGDTSYLGNSYPINTVADTNFSVFTVTNNVCYWSDGTKHIYTSMKSQVGTINVASATNPVVALTNNVPTICNGQATNICVSAPYSSIVSWDWGNTWLSGALPKITAKQSVGSIYYYFPALVSDSLTDTASTSQVVNFEASSYVYVGSQQYRGSSALTSVTVLPTAAPSGNHCFAPAVPKPFTGSTDTRTYCKGAQIVMLADTTVIADSVQWYKVVYGDTVYAGQGYTISVTVDTNCQYLARNLNICDCSSPGTYYSVWTLMASYSVTTAYTASPFWVTNNMPAIASGTQIDLVPGIDSSAFVDFGLYMDNANVTGTKSVTANNNISGLGITLTNSTTVPQTVRYWILSETSSYIGNTLSGSIIVLPSGSTAPTGNHCLYPPSINPSITSTLQTDCYVKGATANLDLNHITESPTPFYYTAVAADSVDWYKSRWPGDTTWLGNSYPVNALADTGCTIYTVSKNVCYWSDSSKHVYSSIQSRVLRMNVLSGTNPTVTLVNNTPYTCSGVPANIQVTGTNSTMEWMRDNTPKVTGPLEAGIRTTTATIIDTLRDTTTIPQVVHFEVEAFTTISGQTCWGSSALTGVTVNPPCGSWANIATGVYPNNDSICPGATATLTADTLPCTGGTRYLWSSGDTTQSITKSTAGTYTVTATNTCGCSATASGIIVIRSNPSPTVNSPSICLGTTATMTATGGSHYLWSNADTTASITTGTAGTYTVTATNTYGCSATANGTLTVNANPSPIVNNDTICSGATATLTATGGTRYLWSTGDSTASVSLTPYSSGTYTVTVTNASGCSASASGIVTVHPSPSPAINNDTICSGATATLTATGGTSYRWYIGDTTASINVTTAGEYWVVISNSYGCVTVTSASVTVNASPIPAITVSVICSGGTPTFTASGGTAYLWNTGATTPVIIDTIQGAYTVTVTNSSGCSAIATTIDTGYMAPSFSVISTSICTGDTGLLTAPGGTFYIWSNGDTTPSIRVSIAGTYSVTATNISGCTASASGTVVVNSNPSPTVNNDTICQGTTGILTATGGGSYLWSIPDTAANLTVRDSGTYTVTVTNEYGCSAKVSGNVIWNTNPIANAGSDTFGCNGTVISIGGSPIDTGGKPPYTFTWRPTAGLNDSTLANPTVTISSSVTYYLTVRDSNGCIGISWVNVIDITPPAPVSPAPQAVASDTPYTFTYSIINPPLDTNAIVEWSLDSNFTSPVVTDTFTVTVSSNSDTMIWLRSRDTLTGCISYVSTSIAIVGATHGMPPIDTTIAICSGASDSIAVPASLTGKRYAIRIDTTVINTAFGTGDTLWLITGPIDSSETFNVIVTDTTSGTVTVIDSGIYIMAVPSVSAPVFIAGDTIIFNGDTTWQGYTAIASGASSITYSIDSGGGATIDSLTGRISSVTSSFTVRVTALGLPGCGSQTTTQNVTVTDVGMPVIPAIPPVTVDSPQVISIIIDSILAGANADYIEWSYSPDFSSSYTVSSPASISVSINAPGDTVVYVRSGNKTTGKVSKSLKALPNVVTALLCAGLLDKTGWTYKSLWSDEFNTYTSANNIVSSGKWALDYCWGGGSNCYSSSASCSNHFMNGSYGANLDIADYDYFMNPSSGNHSGVDFNTLGVASLDAVPLPTPFSNISSNSNYCAGYPSGPYYFSSGALVATNPIPIGTSGLLEIRCIKPGSWDGIKLGVWLNPNTYNTAYNLLDETPDDYTQIMSTQNITESGFQCNRNFVKRSPCDYAQDWHTYDWAYTGTGTSSNPLEIMFFMDGKEMWSRTLYPNYNNLSFTSTTYSTFIIGLQAEAYTWDKTASQSGLIDYVRYYQPSSSNSPNQCLQNTFATGIGSLYPAPKTLEGPSIPTIAQPGDPQILYSPGSGLTQQPLAQVLPGHTFKAITSGSQTTLFYKGQYNILYRANNATGPWTQNGLIGVASIPITYIIGHTIYHGFSISSADIFDFVTPASSNLVYFQTTVNKLGYLENNSGAWTENYAINGSTHAPINNCGGYLFVDNLSRVWYKDNTNSKICTWAPWGSYSIGEISTLHSMPGNVVIASCGCLAFYRDADGNLRQLFWGIGPLPSLGNVWWEFDNPVVDHSNNPYNVSVTDNFILDEANSRVYFIGSDNAVYYYTWNYSSISTTPIVRLGQNATEHSNAGLLAGAWCNGLNPFNAASDLALGFGTNGRPQLYYTATDGTIWYYFNDNENLQLPHINSLPNWNKTPWTGIGEPTSNSIAITTSPTLTVPYNLFFVRSSDRTICSPSWVGADVPQNCNTNSVLPTIYYKEDRTDSVPPSMLNVVVYPNPSDNIFNVTVNNVNLNVTLQFSIETIDGSVIYQTSGYVADGSGQYTFTWDAAAMNSGLYFCRIRSSDGKSCIGKMVKL